MKPFHFKLLILLLVTSVLLSACNLSSSAATQISPEQLNTMTAATVSAKLTQISVQTLVAEATQWAMATYTPSNTETPTVTPTPLFTSTSTATATATATATSTATPIATATATLPPIPCNQAAYISDVTISDGTAMVAGQSFVKTWRIQNTGSCTWTTAYKIYFVSGNAMSAAASIVFPKSVKPGETVDLSVSMVAPANNGSFQGNWMLSAPNGSVFGVGTGGGVPLYVKISVASIPAPVDTTTVYDFVGNYCSAQWRTNAGFISCPTGSYDYKNGTITRSYTPILESGFVDDEGALITIPSYGGDGFIQGQFPKITIHSGDHFKATLTCTKNMPNCSVTYELLYMVSGTSTATSLGTWNKVYDGSYNQVDVDLSSLDGKEIIFFLKVSSQGDPTDDFAQWMAARIAHP